MYIPFPRTNLKEFHSIINETCIGKNNIPFKRSNKSSYRISIQNIKAAQNWNHREGEMWWALPISENSNPYSINDTPLQNQILFTTM